MLFEALRGAGVAVDVDLILGVVERREPRGALLLRFAEAVLDATDATPAALANGGSS